MKQGWISVHRQIQENWIWNDKPFSQGQAWIDLLLMANHSGNKFPIGNEIVTVETGSFITSEVKLMEKWGWSKTKVRKFLDLLISDNMIIKNSDRRKTTITIVNYSVYQNAETTKRPTKNYQETEKEPLKDTNNNGNNSNNENKYFISPSVEEVREYCEQRKNHVDPEKFVDYYKSNGWKVGKNKMKDWKAAIRTWEKNNSSFSGKINTVVDHGNMTDLDDLF